MWGTHWTDQNHSEYPKISAIRLRAPLAMIAAGATLLLSGCAYQGLGVDRYAAFAVRGDGTIAAPPAASAAITYNPALAPVGGQMKATLVPSGTSTVADFSVSGLMPNRGYSVIAH